MQRPLAWLCMAFLAGVAVGWGGVAGRGWGYRAAFLLWAVLAALWEMRRPSLAFLLGLMGAFALGAWRVDWHLARWEEDPLRPYEGRVVTLLGWVDVPPQERNGRWRWGIRVQAVEMGRRVYSARSRVALYGDGPPKATNGELLAWGDQISIRGTLEQPSDATNPGGFSLRRALAREGISWVFWPLERALPLLVARDVGPWWGTKMHRLRRALMERLTATMPPPYPKETAALVGSVVYGLYTAPVPPTLEEAFRRSGLIHLLVASGTQVSLLLLMVLLLTRWLALPRWLLLPLGVATIVFYAFLAGGEPSIWRAVGMGIVLLLAIVTGRASDARTALALAVAMLVAVRPLEWDLFSASSASLHLSAAAVWGLIHLGPLLERWLGFLPAWLRYPLAFSWAAQLALGPILAYHFHRFYPYSPLANIPGYFLAGGLLAGGAVASGLSGIWPQGAEGVNHFNHGLADLLMGTATAIARWPWSQVLCSLSLGGLVASYAFLALLPSLAERRRSWRLTPERLVVGAAGAVALLSLLFLWGASRQWLEIRVLDVGNGDAVVLRSPDGHTALIDAGPYQEREDGSAYDAGERVVVPALLSLGIRRLDWLVLTHGHDDHIGGALAVLEALPVKRILIAPTPTPSLRYEATLRRARERGIPLLTARRGMCLPLGKRVALWVLWPPNPPLRGTGNDINNNALVLKAVYGRIAFLLMGDLEGEGEEALLSCRDLLRSTVLKVPHHGSASACSEALLRRVRPAYAVISVGRRNPFGHPAKEVLQRLAAQGVQVYRTDRDGAVNLRTRGERLTITLGGK